MACWWELRKVCSVDDRHLAEGFTNACLVHEELRVCICLRMVGGDTATYT